MRPKSMTTPATAHRSGALAAAAYAINWGVDGSPIAHGLAKATASLPTAIRRNKAVVLVRRRHFQVGAIQETTPRQGPTRPTGLRLNRTAITEIMFRVVNKGDKEIMNRLSPVVEKEPWLAFFVLPSPR